MKEYKHIGVKELKRAHNRFQKLYYKKVFIFKGAGIPDGIADFKSISFFGLHIGWVVKIKR